MHMAAQMELQNEGPQVFSSGSHLVLNQDRELSTAWANGSIVNNNRDKKLFTPAAILVRFDP